MKFLKNRVQEGLKGRNKGISGGLTRFDKFTNNIQKGRYDVIGALQKTGKTAFVDHRYVLQPYLSGYKNIHWKYYSYEVDLENKLAKYCAYLMYYKYDIVCDSNYILGKGEYAGLLSEDHQNLVNEISDNELVELFGEYDENGKQLTKGMIDFHQDKNNPTGIQNELISYAKEHGEFITEKYQTQDDNGTPILKERIVGYKENDSDLYTIIILDHAGLLRKERGFNKKDNIDKMSEYFVWFRNICKFTPVILSQFNRDLGKIDRLKFSGEDLQPSMEDFKDTGNLGEDASQVIALFNPNLYNHIKKHRNYDLQKLNGGYRSIHLLASRDTETNVSLSAYLEGKNGYWKELPKETEINYSNLNF